MARSVRKKEDLTTAFDPDADAPGSSAVAVGAVSAPVRSAPVLRPPSTANAAVERAATPEARAERVLEGYIEVAKWPRLRGWARDPAAPGGRVRLELADGHRRVLTVVASGSRPDLTVAGVGDGLHGFDVDLNSALLKYRSDQAGSSATAITMTANPS
jgi:hypothetical protein